MSAAHVVLLIGVFIAVAAIAGYLIAITLILKHVVNRLVTILGAVQATTDTAQPVGAVIDDINKDLDAGRKLMENCVQRLEESREPVGATAGSDRHGVPEHWSDTREGATITAVLPPTPGPPPAATTIPSPNRAPAAPPPDRAPAAPPPDRAAPPPNRAAPRPTPAAPSPAPADPDRPGEPSHERKRGWWSR